MPRKINTVIPDVPEDKHRDTRCPGRLNPWYQMSRKINTIISDTPEDFQYFPWCFYPKFRRDTKYIKRIHTKAKWEISTGTSLIVKQKYRQNNSRNKSTDNGITVDNISDVINIDDTTNVITVEHAPNVITIDNAPNVITIDHAPNVITIDHAPNGMKTTGWLLPRMKLPVNFVERKKLLLRKTMCQNQWVSRNLQRIKIYLIHRSQGHQIVECLETGHFNLKNLTWL